MTEIKHTLRFAYPNGSEKPTIGEIENFVKSLDANPGDMYATYRIAEEKTIFIKFKCEESMQYAWMHNPEQLTFHYANGKSVDVRMTVVGGNFQYIRIYGLPPEVTGNDVTLVLRKYGKVKRVIQEKFPTEFGLDMCTGVRGIYMNVEKEIPSSLKFFKWKGNVFYSGNKNRCFLCKAEDHRMNSCPSRKPRKQPEKQQQDEQSEKDVERKADEEQCTDTGSYAAVIADTAAAEMIAVHDEEATVIDELTPDS